MTLGFKKSLEPLCCSVFHGFGGYIRLSYIIYIYTVISVTSVITQ